MFLKKADKKHIASFFLLSVLVAGCVFPFTTTSYKWRIRYDKNKLAFKKEFLKEELKPYSGERLPNILVIVVDDQVNPKYPVTDPPR